MGRSYEFLGTAEGIAKFPATQITSGEGIFDFSVDNSIAGWQDLKCIHNIQPHIGGKYVCVLYLGHRKT